MAIKISFELDSDDDRVMVNALILHYEALDTDHPAHIGACNHDSITLLKELRQMQKAPTLSIPGLAPHGIFDGVGVADVIANCIPTLDTAPPVDPATIGFGQEAVPDEDVPEYDAAGLRYDSRIHSSGKTKNADGTWRNKKGLNPVVKNQVEAEIYAKTPADNTTAAVTVVPAPPVIPPLPAAPVIPPLPAAPVIPPPPAAVVNTAVSNFAQLLMRLTNAKLTAPQIAERCARCNPPVASFAELHKRPDAWATMVEDI